MPLFRNPIAGDGQAQTDMLQIPFQEYSRRDWTNKLDYEVALGKNHITANGWL